MRDWLIITNGDSAAERMREARIDGEILPWRDVLHEGPVPANLNLEELSAVRAWFLAQRGWIGEEELRTAFHARDTLIRQHRDFSTVVLWFEHDLYDQLQLLQILDFFSSEKRHSGLYLIQSGAHLGQETPKALKKHLSLMEPVTEAQLVLGRLAWNAFRAPSPEAFASLLGVNTHILPFLRLAMIRLLDELPNYRSGLSRTEWTILSLIAQGIRHPKELYQAFTENEEVHFMGDWSFFHTLDQLGRGGIPLLAGFQGLSFSPTLPEAERDAYFECEISFTHIGYSVLTGAADALRYRPLNRTLGGFELNPRTPWRWDHATRRLIPPPGH